LWIFEHLCRDPRATIVLINPKGALARMARDWTIGHGQSKRLEWLDPGDQQAIMGYNPLRRNGLAIATHAKTVREAIRSAWGQSSFDQTPQLARLLFLALAISLALERTLLDSLLLLRSGPTGSKMRRDFLLELSRDCVRDESGVLTFLAGALETFESLNERRQEELAASAIARLESFICDPAISRILTQPQSVDLGEVIAQHKILLVNLEIGRPLRLDDVKLLGRFIVNDVVNHVFSRTPSPNEPVYLILDEVQNFATRDLCSILDMGRELGLHCIFAHQTLGQLRSEDETGSLYASVRGCARTKFYFGGLGTEDLDVLVRDACIEQFDPYKIKDELTTLSLDPIESRRRVTTQGLNIGASAGTAAGNSRERSRVSAVGLSRNEGESSTDGENIGTTLSAGHASGAQLGLGAGETILPSGEIIETSNEIDGTSSTDIINQSDIYTEMHARSRQSSRGIQASRAEGEGEGTQQTRSLNLTATWNTSTSDVPFYEYKKEYRVSSRTFQSEQEYLTENLQKLMGQRIAHAFVKVSCKPGRFLILPQVRTPWISDRTREAGLSRVFDKPFYFHPGETHEAEHGSQNLALPEAIDRKEPSEETLETVRSEQKTDAVDQVPRVSVKDSVDLAMNEEDFAGPEVVLKPWKVRKKKS
jgi:hypothetical protein